MSFPLGGGYTGYRISFSSFALLYIPPHFVLIDQNYTLTKTEKNHTNYSLFFKIAGMVGMVGMVLIYRCLWHISTSFTMPTNHANPLEVGMKKPKNDYIMPTMPPCQPHFKKISGKRKSYTFHCARSPT